MTAYVVARVEDLPVGGKARVMAGRRTLCLFRAEDGFFALADRCPHAGANLSDGKLSGIVESDGPGDYRLCRQNEMVKCPWHGWEFDIRTGQSWSDPAATRVRAFEAREEAGTALVRGPYVAETVPVSVEGNYVIVEA